MGAHYYPAETARGRRVHLLTPTEIRSGVSGWRRTLCGAEIRLSTVRTSDGPHALRWWQETEPDLCAHCWQTARGDREVARA